LDEPISEDELAEWSSDIDLFMEGLTNPDKLETLWEKSKAKKLWDSSQNKSSTQLDQYLSGSHLAEDSVSIKDYMSRWCNVIQTPNSPTPLEDLRSPQLFSPKERDNLEKYDKFINELSVQIKGGWIPAGTLPYDEDLLRHTLGFSPDSDQVLKINRLALQPDSDKRTKPDKKSNFTVKGELLSSNQKERQQLSEDEELPFQQGLPLKEDNINSKIRGHNREIFMAFLSNATNQKANSMTLEDLDYDEFLSEPEITEAAAANHENPPLGITVTVHLDNNPKMIPKIEHHQQLGNSFDYSNNDLHNVINIGRNTKTVIINKREDHEEVEAYSLTSNYRIPDIYGYNPRK